MCARARASADLDKAPEQARPRHLEGPVVPARFRRVRVGGVRVGTMGRIRVGLTWTEPEPGLWYGVRAIFVDGLRVGIMNAVRVSVVDGVRVSITDGVSIMDESASGRPSQRLGRCRSWRRSRARALLRGWTAGRAESESGGGGAAAGHGAGDGAAARCRCCRCCCCCRRLCSRWDGGDGEQRRNFSQGRVAPRVRRRQSTGTTRSRFRARRGFVSHSRRTLPFPARVTVRPARNARISKAAG